MAETLLLEIDVSASVDNLAAIRQELNTLIALRKDLSEKSKAGDIQATKELEKLNSVIRNSQVEYKQQQRVLDGYVNAQKANVNTSNLAANSIQTNRDLLKQLTAQYINLKNPSANATSQLKHLSDVLKQQEAAIGNTSRNVGNYKESILDAVGGLNIFGQSANTIINPLKNMGAAFGSAGGGAAGLGASLATVGIPLFAAGIQGAISIMQKFDSVTEGLEDTMGGLNQAFDFFVSNASFSSLSGFIDGLEKAYDAGVQLSEQLRKINDAQLVARADNARAQRDVEALLLQARDRTKTEQERIDLLDKASILEEKSLKRELEVAEQRGLLATKEFARIQSQGLNDDEARKNISDAQVAIFNLQRESGNLQEKIAVRRNALLQEIAENESKFAEQRAKDLEAQNKKLEELADKNAERERVFIESSTEGTEQRIALFELEFEKRREIMRDAGVSELNIERIYQEERTKVVYSEQAKRLLAEENEKDAAFAILNDNAAKQLELQRLTGESQNEIDRQFAESNYQTFKEFYDAKKKLYEDDVKAQAEAEKQKEQVMQAEVSFASSVSSSLIGFVRDVADASGASAAFSKAVAAIEIGVKTALALVGAIAQAQAVPYPANLVAIATGVAAVTAGIASAVALFRKVPDNPPRPSFALGGGIDIDGNSHSQGGTPIHVNGRYVAEAERGEKLFILKKNASENIGLLSAFNQRFGGVSFTGGKVSKAANGGFISDGGFAARDLSRNIDNAITANQMEEMIRRLPAPKLSIVELNDKQNERSRSIDISEA